MTNGARAASARRPLTRYPRAPIRTRPLSERNSAGAALILEEIGRPSGEKEVELVVADRREIVQVRFEKLRGYLEIPEGRVIRRCLTGHVDGLTVANCAHGHLKPPSVVAGPGLLRRVKLGGDHVTGVDALGAKSAASAKSYGHAE